MKMYKTNKINSKLIILGITSILLVGCGSSSTSVSTSNTYAGDRGGSSDTIEDFSYVTANGGFGLEADIEASHKGGLSSLVDAISNDTDYEYSEDYYDYNDNYTDEEIEINIDDKVNQQKDNNLNTDKYLYEDKLIYRCTMEIETLEYNNSYKILQELLDTYECRIESENFYDETSHYGYSYNSYKNYSNGKFNIIVIRVPSKYFKEFVNNSSSLGNVISKRSEVENITQTYYDTTARAEGLEIQLNRLKEMLQQAYEVNDMIQLNREITEVENQLNQLRTQIRTMDMDTTYSYVSISLQEVVEYTEAATQIRTNTFIDRLKNTIINTWEDTKDAAEEILFTIIHSLPILIIIGLLILIFHKPLLKKYRSYRDFKKSLIEGLEEDNISTAIINDNTLNNNFTQNVESDKNNE